MRRCTRVGAWVALCASCSGEALADDPVAAEANFQRGLKELKAGNYEVACPALAESERLESRPGTLFTLADCEARWGKSATSVAHFQDYLTRVSRLTGTAKAAHRERVTLANARLKELSPKVPQLTLILPKDAPTGTEVRRDDVVLGEPSLGVAISIDPGHHTVTTVAPGGAPHAITVDIEPGDRKTVELTVDPAPSPPPSSAARPEPAWDTPAPSAPRSPQRTIGLVLGGVGLAGIAVGAVAGILVIGQKSTVDEDCPGAVCHGQGMEEVDTLHTTAMVSNIAFVAGGALLVGGGVLFFTAPSTTTAEPTTGWRWAPTAGPHGGALRVGRTW